MKKTPLKNKMTMLILLLLFFSWPAQALEIELDYPSGRFREDSPPTFFKWNLYGQAGTFALKVFRKQPNGTFDEVRDLIARFDILAEQQSLTWPYEPLSRGDYVWTIEGYDQVRPQPRFVQKTEFIVEPFFDIDLRTKRYGLMFGFSRGAFKSSDTVYDLEFQTTPTNYGATLTAGDENHFWDLQAQMADFTLRGSVRRTFNGYFASSYRINDPNESKMEWFLGPTLRAFNYPRVTTTDGVTLDIDGITQLSTGFLLSAQKRFGFKITGYSQLQFEIPVLSNGQLVSGRSFGYGVSAGLLFGHIWPLSFGGEVSYRFDQSTTDKNGNDVQIRMEGWNLMGNMTYTFK